MRQLVIPAMLGLMLVACGEYESKTPYENGGFQGKQDVRVWDQEKFGRSREGWVEIIHARNLSQSEYRKTDGQE